MLLLLVTFTFLHTHTQTLSRETGGAFVTLMNGIVKKTFLQSGPSLSRMHYISFELSFTTRRRVA